MSIYEAIGIGWVILTSALATVAIFVCAARGLRSLIDVSRVEPSTTTTATTTLDVVEGGGAKWWRDER